MAFQNSIYTLSASDYTPDTFTELVPLADDFIMASLIMANDTNGDVVIEVELVDDLGARLALIVPAFTLASKSSQSLEIRSLNVVTNHALRVKSSAVGVSFIASGASRV